MRQCIWMVPQTYFAHSVAVLSVVFCRFQKALQHDLRSLISTNKMHYHVLQELQFTNVKIWPRGYKIENKAQ